MDKRYQVFVSSTFADLQDERQRVLQTLMEMDCIPAGMELFPAADEEQWEFIQKVIDDCDYYLLIIGGRYGSLSTEGVSYTEKEYDYAVTRGLRVIALIHGDPDAIPSGKSESDPELREKLKSFREKVSAGRLVKFWEKAEQLPGLVSLSLNKTIKTHPAVGWIRADRVGSEELLAEIHALRKKNEELVTSLRELEGNQTIAGEELAGGGDEFTIHGTYGLPSNADMTRHWSVRLSWDSIFSLIGPTLLEPKTDIVVRAQLAAGAFAATSIDGILVRIADEDFGTIKIHLIVLGLVRVEVLPTNRGTALFWALTAFGRHHLFKIRSVKKAPEETDDEDQS